MTGIHGKGHSPSATKIHWREVILTLVVALFASNAYSTSVLPVTLQTMTERAELIFHGRVTSSEAVRDQQTGRIATLTTFEVIEPVKGDTGDTHTIKQIGGSLDDGRSLHIHGVPKFKPGQSLVVFLPAPSSLGFSSPVGLQQGQYLVTVTDGRKVVSNGRSLAGNSSGKAARAPLAVQADDPTRAGLDDFLNTVRAYLQD